MMLCLLAAHTASAQQSAPAQESLLALQPVLAQEPTPAPPSSGSIFQRFDSGREIPKTWQTTLELPVLAVPQVAPDARIVTDVGLNWVTAYRPESRYYFSRSFGFAKLEWAPKNNQVKTAQVITLDRTEIFNIRATNWLIVSFGLGLGLMHGLSVEHDHEFQARFEPFIPVQVGLAVPIGRSFLFGIKVIQSSFFGPGPVLSVMRGLVGFGYNY